MSRHKNAKIDISDNIMKEIETHCFSEVSHEVGGFLIGQISDGLTHIVGAIASTKAQSQPTSLTFTHEAWDEAYQALAQNFPDAQIVGWYHSHPGFGVFMSDYDAFIQQNFFGSAGQIALVVDPLAGKAGWFRWKETKVTQLTTFKTMREGLGGEAADHVPTTTTTAAKPVTPPQSVVAALLAVILVGMLAFFLGQRSSSPDGQGNLMLVQQNQALRSAAQGQLFIEAVPGDPKRSTFYIRYQLTQLDFQDAGWPINISFKFGTTLEDLKKANPEVNFEGPAPTYLVIPVKGWVKNPGAIPVETLEPSTSPTPTTKPSGTSKPTVTTKPTATTKPSKTAKPSATATSTTSSQPTPSPEGTP